MLRPERAPPPPPKKEQNQKSPSVATIGYSPPLRRHRSPGARPAQRRSGPAGAGDHLHRAPAGGGAGGGLKSDGSFGVVGRWAEAARVFGVVFGGEVLECVFFAAFWGETVAERWKRSKSSKPSFEWGRLNMKQNLRCFPLFTRCGPTMDAPLALAV